MSTSSPLTRRSPTPSRASPPPGAPADAIKDAILSASGGGWTSPLRIAKRGDSASPTPASPRMPSQRPAQVPQEGVARRQSSSFNHVRKNNLVSNSPFRSADPSNAPLGARYRPAPSYAGIGHTPRLPSTIQARRASGERRVSAERRAAKSHENARPSQPAVLTPIPRKTSKTLQKEPAPRPPLADVQDTVQQSDAEVEADAGAHTDEHESAYEDVHDDEHEAATDADHEQEHEEEPPVASPRPPSPPRPAASDSLSGASRKPFPAGLSRVPASNAPTAKSNLVSKRLIGPRSISGGSLDSNGRPRRRRRKTVTFDPRCNVLEFSADEEDEDEEWEDEDEDADAEADTTHESMDSDTNTNADIEGEGEHRLNLSVQTNTPKSDLSSLVDRLLADDMPGTPPGHETSFADMEGEDGVPYGRSHHAERAHELHHQHTGSIASTDISLSSIEPSSPIFSDSHDPATPDTEEAPHSPPFGRRQHSEEDREHPGSPSPSSRRASYNNDGGLMPTFDNSAFDVTPTKERLFSMDDDPFDEDAETVPDRVSSPTPRISRVDVMRQLHARRAGSASPVSPPTNSALPLPVSPIQLGRAATPTTPQPHSRSHSPLVHSPSSQRPPSHVDKPLPIAPGPPIIGIHRFERDADVSFSESMGLASDEEDQDLGESEDQDLGESEDQDLGESEDQDLGESEDQDQDEQDQNLDADNSGVEQDVSVEELLRGVERDMEMHTSNHHRSPAMESSLASEGQTPLFDGESHTNDDDDTSFPSTPDTPFTPAGTDDGHYHQQHDAKHDPDTTPTAADDHEHGYLHRRPTTQLLQLPVPDMGIGGDQMFGSLTRSGTGASSRIAQRAASIRLKKREKRESGGSGRMRARRSLSVADAQDLLADDDDDAVIQPIRPQSMLLPSQMRTAVALPASNAPPLADSIDAELRRRQPEGQKSKYRLREAASVVYAADDKVANAGRTGDIDSGRAWKIIRRPSDMNDYSRQMRELRQQDKAGKAFGKVFVRVVGIKDLNVPVPPQATKFTCTLNNGIHFVTTPECPLATNCKVDQEFELIEHPKLEWTLTIKVKKDAHLLPPRAESVMPLPPPSRPAPPPQTKSAPAGPHSKVAGMLAFFGGTPKKPKAGRGGSPAPQAAPPSPVTAPTQPAYTPTGLARYLKQDGTLGRVFVSFADVASRCDTKLFETGFPLVGTKPGTTGEAVVLGELVVQLFRLPPLPGVPNSQLPQSLEECHRGLRHVSWHKVTYFEGTLTQYGADCTTWRRRHFRVIGGNLVAFNDVTKKITTKIDLRAAKAVIDDDDASLRRRDSGDALFQIERAFRLVFEPIDKRVSRRGEEICFYADTDEEKAQWLEVLNALVGHIPPNPLWAELVWQRQQELERDGASAPAAVSQGSAEASASSSAAQTPRPAR